MSNKSIDSLIGLATRARKTASGGFLVERAVKAGEAYLVLIAGDASANSRKEFVDMCEYRKIPYYIYSTKEELGHCMGKEERVVVALLDRGFANSIRNKMDNNI